MKECARRLRTENSTGRITVGFLCSQPGFQAANRIFLPVGKTRSQHSYINRVRTHLNVLGDGRCPDGRALSYSNATCRRRA
jgi:hypothetical protein